MLLYFTVSSPWYCQMNLMTISSSQSLTNSNSKLIGKTLLTNMPTTLLLSMKYRMILLSCLLIDNYIYNHLICAPYTFECKCLAVEFTLWISCWQHSFIEFNLFLIQKYTLSVHINTDGVFGDTFRIIWPDGKFNHPHMWKNLVVQPRKVGKYYSLISEPNPDGSIILLCLRTLPHHISCQH